MLKDKIIDWLEEKHESDPYFDYETIATKMMEIYEENGEDELNCKDLYQEAIEQLDDDGGMYPNGVDYDE